MPKSHLDSNVLHAACNILHTLHDERQKHNFYNTNDTYELDIRLGIVRSLIAGERTQRSRAIDVDDTHGAYTFETIIDPNLFYATFSALYEQPTTLSVSDLQRSEHDTFSLLPNARRERIITNTIDVNNINRWIQKIDIGVTIDVPLSTHNCWFDVRFAASREVLVQPSHQLRAAMVLYENNSAPESLRTAFATSARPIRTRRRTRRSMLFIDIPAWRLDATRIDVILFSTPTSSSSSYPVTNTHYELELEYIGYNEDSLLLIDEHARQAVVLIERIATALGRSQRDITRYLEHARIEHYRNTLTSNLDNKNN